MKIRSYKKEDYFTVYSWWSAHKGWKPIDKEILPSCGFIVDDVCAGFLYLTNSKAAILEWIVSNPVSTKDQRKRGLDLLIKTATKTAKQEGFDFIFTWADHPGLEKKLQEHEFKNGGDCTTYMRRM